MDAAGRQRCLLGPGGEGHEWPIPPSGQVGDSSQDASAAEGRRRRGGRAAGGGVAGAVRPWPSARAGIEAARRGAVRTTRGRPRRLCSDRAGARLSLVVRRRSRTRRDRAIGGAPRGRRRVVRLRPSCERRRRGVEPGLRPPSCRGALPSERGTFAQKHLTVKTVAAGSRGMIRTMEWAIHRSPSGAAGTARRTGGIHAASIFLVLSCAGAADVQGPHGRARAAAARAGSAVVPPCPTPPARAPPPGAPAPPPRRGSGRARGRGRPPGSPGPRGGRPPPRRDD